MAKRYKLKEVEKLHGNLHEIIPQLVNIGGQSHAASVLGTSQATIARWLSMNGYAQVIRYERRDE
jgi:hypothetical protein